MEKSMAYLLCSVLILVILQLPANYALGNKTISPLSKFVAALSKPGAFAKEVSLIYNNLKIANIII